MKLKAAFIYRMRSLLISASFYFFFFFLFAGVIPFIGMLMAGDVTIDVNSDLMISMMIYIGIISYLGINVDFKLFIQNGMNRRNIFFVNVLAAVVVSAGMSLILFAIAELFTTNFVAGFQFNLPFVTFYTGNNRWLTFVLLFAFLFLASIFGLLFGVFNDRVNGITKIVVIGLCIMIPISFMMLAQIYRDTLLVGIFDFLKWLTGLQSATPDTLHILVTLFAAAGIGLVITYLLNFRRELKRINA